MQWNTLVLCGKYLKKNFSTEAGPLEIYFSKRRLAKLSKSSSSGPEKWAQDIISELAT